MAEANTENNKNKNSANKQIDMQTPIWAFCTMTTERTAATRANNTNAHRKRRNIRAVKWRLRHVCKVSYLGAVSLWLLLMLTTHSTINATEVHQDNSHKTTTVTKTASASIGEMATVKYSQPLTMDDDDDNNSFHPIIPKDINTEDISRNVFTESGQYRVFQPVESDLRAATIAGSRSHAVAGSGISNSRTRNKIPQQTITNIAVKVEQREHETLKAATPTKTAIPNAIQATARGNAEKTVILNEISQDNHERVDPNKLPNVGSFKDMLNSELKGLEELLTEYVQNFFNNGQYEPMPGLIVELQKNHSVPLDSANGTKRQLRQAESTQHIGGNNSRAMETGRLLFFTGLKKVMWPIFMGLQLLKSLLFALFLPTIIGSFGKLLGKGITSGSVPLFIRPMDAPQDLDFKDNTFNFDDDNKFMLMADDGGKDAAYAYNQPEASQTHNQYIYNPASLNQQVLSRYGMNEQQKMQDSYLSALQSLSSASFKNSNSISGSSSAGMGAGLSAAMRNKPVAAANVNTFQTFQKVPASSLVLSNYDPFYSPLLSRLDSVFAQLKLNSENENCREKLICLMYANPAKYAPYSNLVSAQLSRELNELRKPTSDNPDILRFFKYMRAAKDGQDGVDCEKTFDTCKEFKDFENPAMVSTYHDINKLVQARKITT